VLENIAMKSMRGLLTASGLVVLAGGCGGEYITNTMGNVTFQRNNGEVTVTIGSDVITDGSGNVAKEPRQVAAFHSLVVNHGIEASVEDGNAGEATVEADDNLLPLIETKVEDGVLRVQVVGSLKTRNPIRVTMGATDLSEAVAISSASITAPRLSGDRVRAEAHSGAQVTVDQVEGEQIELTASSSGQVAAADIKGQRLHAKAASSGRIEAAGEVDEQDVQVDSSGMYEGESVASRTARVNASSAGSAAVQATEEVTGAASSAGQVRYFGDPAKVSVQTSSAGTATEG
jgi:hypothetical protein